MAKPDTSTFWTRTKDAFKEAGLPHTQEDVAKFLGIAQPSISDWNKPDGYPTIANAIRLAKRANVTVEWLLTGRGQRRLPPPDGAAERLWGTWADLDPVSQGQVLGFAQSLVPPADQKNATR